MSWQLEYSEYSDQSDNTENCKRHGLVLTVLIRHNRRFWSDFLLFFSHNSSKGDKIRYDCHQVNHVHNVFTEFHFAWTSKKSHKKFKCEPNYAQSLHYKEWIRYIWHLKHIKFEIKDYICNNYFIFLHFSTIGSCVEDFVMLELWQSFQAKYNYGQKDDEHWDDGDYPGMLTGLRVLKQQPNTTLEIICWQWLFFFLNKSLIFSEFGNYLYSKMISNENNLNLLIALSPNS